MIEALLGMIVFLNVLLIYTIYCGMKVFALAMDRLMEIIEDKENGY